MDGTTLHLLDRLQAIRETQLLHGQLLEETAAAVSSLKAASTPRETLKGSLMPIVAGAVQWVGGLVALVILMRGGDAQTAMAFLQKLF